MDLVNGRHYLDLKVVELKQELRARGLPTGGLKCVLQARLRRDMQEQEDEAVPVPGNVSELEGEGQTKERAELVAACCALEHAIAQGHLAVEVKTSYYVVNAMTNLVAKWQERGWVTRRKAPVVNRGDFERLDLLCQQVQVKWVDINHGMHEAARLAHEAK